MTKQQAEMRWLEIGARKLELRRRFGIGVVGAEPPGPVVMETIATLNRERDECLRIMGATR